MDLSAYHNRYKLLNARTDEDVSENCLLFSVVHCFLRQLAGNPIDNEEFQAICWYIDHLWNEETQRFNNIVGVTSGKDRFISRDQYIALCCFSYFYRLDYHKRFWKGIRAGTYDNLTGKFNPYRLVWPREFIFIGHLNGNKFCTLLMPLFCLLTACSFISDRETRPTFWERLKSNFKLTTYTQLKTSGQILSFVKVFCFRKERPWILNKTWNWCMNLCKKRYISGFNTLIDHYYEKNHPNNTTSKRIIDYGV